MHTFTGRGGTCSLNATNAFLPARLLRREGNSNRADSIPRACEIRATTGASHAATYPDHYSVRLSPRYIIRSFDPMSQVRYPRADRAGRVGVTKFSIISPLLDPSRNREWHRRLSTYVRETLPRMGSNGHFARPTSACFHAF